MQTTDDFGSTDGVMSDIDTGAQADFVPEAGRRIAWRWRFVGWGATMLAVVVALAIIVQPAWLHWPQSSGKHGVTVPTLVPNAVILDSDISSAYVTLNDQTQILTPWMQLKLRAGANHLRIDAAPFAPLTCDIAWPPPAQGPCPMTQKVLVTEPDGQRGFVFVVRVTHPLATLPTAQQTEIKALLAQQIAAVPARLQTAIVPGMHYGNGQLSQTGLPAVASATQPGIMHMALIAIDAQPPDCVALPCLAPFGDFALSGIPLPFWQVAVPVKVTWQYAAHTASIEYPPVYNQAILLTLDLYRLDGVWEVANFPLRINQAGLDGQIAERYCEAGRAFINRVLAPATITSSFDGPPGSARAAAWGVEGCTLTIKAVVDGTQVTGRFIVRFGVILAADAGAQRLVPDATLATSAEIAAVNVG